MDFIDITKNLLNGENMGGLTKTIIFGLWDDVAAWPTAPVAPADIEANAAWVGDVVMKAGKRAFTMYTTDDTAELQINQVGEVDGISLLMKLNMFHPGLRKKILGFINAAKNEDLFFIAQDREGQYFLLGDTKHAAHMVAGDGSGTGKAKTDRKGANLSFEFPTNAVRVYVGDVTTLISTGSA